MPVVVSANRRLTGRYRVRIAGRRRGRHPGQKEEAGGLLLDDAGAGQAGSHGQRGSVIDWQVDDSARLMDIDPPGLRRFLPGRRAGRGPPAYV